jgi:osmotically-inducible protein OsmY
MDIAVVTTNGDVRLTGMLDSQAQIDEAIRIA